MTTEERFEKLEQQNRKLKKYVAGIAALALVATVAGTVGVVKAGTNKFDKIVANEIQAKVIRVRVPDSKYMFMKLYVNRAGPKIRSYDYQGRFKSYFTWRSK